MKVFIPIFAASALLASTASGWSASSASGNLQVKITIKPECKVNPNGDAVLNFGSHGVVDKDIDQQTANDAVGAIQVQCTNGTPYIIGLGTGKNSTDINNRQMKNKDGDSITYQLFKDSNRTEVWKSDYGLSASAVVNPLSGYAKETYGHTGNGSLQSHQVFGRVKKPATGFKAGEYTDTVAVTVSF